MNVKFLQVFALFLLLASLVGLFAFGSCRAKRATEEGQRARARAQAQLQIARAQAWQAAEAIAPHTVTVRGRLLDEDGKPLGQRTLGFVKDGLRIGDAGFSFMSDGLTGDDGSFRFDMPVGQSWQALLPQGGTLDGPRSGALLIDTPAIGTPLPEYELELRFDGAKLNARLTPLRRSPAQPLPMRMQRAPTFLFATGAHSRLAP
ncbi:MAG: hypothetical protein L0Z50_19980 [Verrucomicrobiales bacterium]|nr:hypothetical protein [Verrucomicrobiales bacterium]